MTLTDIFVQLAVDDVFQAKWTNDIHHEWIAAVLKFRPWIKPQKLERRRLQMDAETREALVTGYEGIVDELHLPDASDRHVLAAAIHGGCGRIVTKNLTHFPVDILSPHGIVAVHPDTFLMELLEAATLQFCGAAKSVIVRARRPRYSVEEYLTNLRRASLQETGSVSLSVETKNFTTEDTEKRRLYAISLCPSFLCGENEFPPTSIHYQETAAELEQFRDLLS